MSQRKNIGEIIAVAWFIVAVVMTVLVGPSLGARGLLWLGVHHLLCLVGCGHEWTKSRRRKKLRALQSEMGVDTDNK